MSILSVLFHAFVRMPKKVMTLRNFAAVQAQMPPGQALLMVIVAMIIILTVSLSVATRSFINVRTTSEEASSSAAFSAAEAGIEKYLKDSQTFTGSIGTSDVSVGTTQVGGNITAVLLNGGNPILKDDGVDVWLSTYPNYTAPYWSGQFRAYWDSGADCNSTAALEFVIITGPSANPLSNPAITRRVYDPCAARRGVNNFSSSSTPGTVLGVSYDNHVLFTIDSVNPGILVRVIPLYANAIVAVTGDTNLPQQGSIVSSTGTAGDTKRKITVYQGFPKVPNEFFSYTMFSP